MSIDVTATTGTRTTDGDGRTWAEAWQSSWDAQQTGFLFDREQRFAALLDLVEVDRRPGPDGRRPGLRHGIDHPPPAGPPARGAGGAVDVDPVLLAIARGSLGGDERVRIVRADLRDPAWVDGLDGVEADAVVTSTALHWLPEDDLARLYRDLHRLVRPGGLVANADTMPADDLPRLSSALTALAERRVAAALAGGVESWRAWWERAAADPVLAGPMAERATLFGGADHPRRSSPRRGGTSPRWRPPVSPRPAWPGGRAPTPSSPPSADPRHAGRCRPRRDWSPRRGPAVEPWAPNWEWVRSGRG